ncbi:MAG: hypothetical protein KatS3mg015_2757 [Fimbriimonadales bacterium]|nr:MAG: hypothetical protein KatS3mg015_2757 [Fimbriimonadales bacterium]
MLHVVGQRTIGRSTQEADALIRSTLERILGPSKGRLLFLLAEENAAEVMDGEASIAYEYAFREEGRGPVKAALFVSLVGVPPSAGELDDLERVAVTDGCEDPYEEVGVYFHAYLEDGNCSADLYVVRRCGEYHAVVLAEGERAGFAGSSVGPACETLLCSKEGRLLPDVVLFEHEDDEALTARGRQHPFREARFVDEAGSSFYPENLLLREEQDD